MNAIKYIKDHGVEKAREVVKGAPARANWYQVKGKYSNDLYSCNHELYGEAIMLSDLKRLVESIDIIKDLDGIDGAKKTLAELIKLEWNEFEHRWIDDWSCTKPRLEQAITDYELIYEVK